MTNNDKLIEKIKAILPIMQGIENVMSVNQIASLIKFKDDSTCSTIRR